MRYLDRAEEIKKAEALIHDVRASIDDLQLQQLGEEPSEDWSEKLRTLNSKLDDIEHLLTQNTRKYVDYSKEYSRYRYEYERLVGSRSIKMALCLRKLYGRRYEDLTPADLETTFDKDDPLWASYDPSQVMPDKMPNVKRFEAAYPSIVAKIGDSNGSGYYQKSSIKAGIITDEFMYNYYKDALGFEYIDYGSYVEQIAQGGYSFILYITGWHGMKGEDYCGDEGLHKVEEIFDYANSIGLTTIFQSIEDPVDYSRYLGIAGKSDVILTSDANMVCEYKKDLDKEKVYALDYGINPRFHNPVDFMKQKRLENDYINRMVFFAGSWYWFYPQRCLDTNRIFMGVMEDKNHELLVADRLSGFEGAEKYLYVFPEEYEKNTIGAIDHADLQKVHKLFDYSICVNTVKDSPTMCAMRVYELQALGSLMLSNYALSVSRNFPSIFMINNWDEVAHILGGYEPREVFAMQVEGIRRMFSGATVYDRLNEVFAHSEIPERFEERSVAVVLPHELFERRDEFPEFSMPGVKAIDADADGGANLTGFDYAVWATEGSLAYRHFLEDAINAFKFVDVDYVRYVDDSDYRDSYTYVNGTAQPEDTLFALDRVDTSCVSDPKYLAGLSGFSVARAIWGRDTSDTPKKLAVIMPIHNNGRHLRERSFLSLLRSSVFSQMRIYLMDDGSSDPYTLQVIDELCADYDNVVACRCGESGSGSASLPRNIGVRESSEPYVTFLDPDNEAIGDGYARLLDSVKANDVDFAIANTYSVSAPDYEPVWADSFDEEGIYSNPRDMLIEQDFTPHNPQACVIRREFLSESGIEFVEGAVGEDTLYYYEMMLNAKSFAYECVPASVYYMESEGSTVNAISASFFEKSLLAERAQVEAFARHGVLDDYKKRHLEFFMDNWYAKKLRIASAKEYLRCVRIVEEIRELYN